MVVQKIPLAPTKLPSVTGTQWESVWTSQYPTYYVPITNSAFWKSTNIFLHSIQTCLFSCITYEVKWPITHLVIEAFGLKPPQLITFQVQHILCLEYHLYYTFISRATSQLRLSPLLCHASDHPALIWKPPVRPSHICRTEISKLRIWSHQFSG